MYLPKLGETILAAPSLAILCGYQSKRCWLKVLIETKRRNNSEKFP
jgi:hypothetical protein